MIYRETRDIGTDTVRYRETVRYRYTEHIVCGKYRVHIVCGKYREHIVRYAVSIESI